MREKRPETFTEPVQAGLAVGRPEDTVSGALSVAGEKERTGPAEEGERPGLRGAECTLSIGGGQVIHVTLEDVPEEVGRIHEVVARVEVTVVFQDKGVAAGGPEDAERGLVVAV